MSVSIRCWRERSSLQFFYHDFYKKRVLPRSGSLILLVYGSCSQMWSLQDYFSISLAGCVIGGGYHPEYCWSCEVGAIIFHEHFLETRYFARTNFRDIVNRTNFARTSCREFCFSSRKVAGEKNFVSFSKSIIERIWQELIVTNSIIPLVNLSAKKVSRDISRELIFAKWLIERISREIIVAKFITPPQSVPANFFHQN